MKKRKTSKNAKKTQPLNEIEKLSKKYETQLAHFELGVSQQDSLNTKLFKKCSLFNSDEYVFVSSSRLVGSTGN